jgi:hypothetical protein
MSALVDSPGEAVLGLIVGVLGLARAAAGRLGPKATLLPILFLMSRWPVLVCSLFGSASTLILLMPGAVARGRTAAPDLLVLFGISSLCGWGFSVLAVGPVFFVARLLGQKPVFELEPGESVLREMAANHFLNGEARGGRLLVTQRRLGFRPHRFNVQLATWSCGLSEIRSLRSEGQRLVVIETAPGDDWVVVANAAAAADELSVAIDRACGSTF